MNFFCDIHHVYDKTKLTCHDTCISVEVMGMASLRTTIFPERRSATTSGGYSGMVGRTLYFPAPEKLQFIYLLYKNIEDRDHDIIYF